MEEQYNELYELAEEIFQDLVGAVSECRERSGLSSYDELDYYMEEMKKLKPKQV